MDAGVGLRWRSRIGGEGRNRRVATTWDQHRSEGEAIGMRGPGKGRANVRITLRARVEVRVRLQDTGKVRVDTGCGRSWLGVGVQH